MQQTKDTKWKEERPPPKIKSKNEKQEEKHSIYGQKHSKEKMNTQQYDIVLWADDHEMFI